MFKYLIFDMDNTIYNYNNCHQKAMHSVLKSISEDYHLDLGNVQSVFTYQKNRFQKSCGNIASSHHKMIQIKYLLTSLNIKLDSLQKYYQQYVNVFQSKMILYDHLLDFFDFCKNKSIKLYILSNNILSIQISHLQKLNIIHFFEKIYTSQEFGIEKPDPKILYYILGELECNKNEIALVGDDFINDIESSKLVNIYSFWFTKSFEITKEFTKFDKYANLLQLFKDYYQLSNKFIKLSKYMGERFDLVQAGGGNTSFKMNNLMFIKSSGCNLSDINFNNNYVGVNYQVIKKEIKLINDLEKKERENKAKIVVNNAKIFLKQFRPSIETTMHSLTSKFTVHLHPIQFNSISGLSNCLDIINKHFKKYCFIEYFTPGIDVAREIEKKYKGENIIFLKNHGLVFTSDKIDDLYQLVEETLIKLEKIISKNFFEYKLVNTISKTFGKRFNSFFTSYCCQDIIINNYIQDNDKLNFTTFLPDKLVYCGKDIVYLENMSNIDECIAEYFNKNKEIPKIIVLKVKNKKILYICSANLNKCKEIESVLRSHVICVTNDVKVLPDKEIKYLNNWEAEKYRMKNK
jgi:HAD superfamily hydrolase (TIGR01549 family)